jgi:phosphatidylinositol alpha 1,6-mannosyltransferase
MRLAIVTESFLPTINGVTNSVCKVLDHARAEGHEAIIIAPAAGSPATYAGFPVHEVPAFAYRQFQVGLPNPQVQKLLAEFRPHVLHAASPFLLGSQALVAAKRLGIPSVAIYQTDVAGYAKRNKLGAASGFVWKIVRRIHDAADRTLAPSSTAMDDLARAGIERVHRWGRGVDLVQFHPAKRLAPGAQAIRSAIAPHGELVVGYVGRVAPEKQIERLAALRGLPGIVIAIVGDGPSMPSVKKALAGMPVAFLGKLRGDDLAEAYASFDIFIHTGTEETFGQTIQEAHASGLPVIAPRAGGPIDLVKNAVTGLLFEPDHNAGMRSMVAALVRDEALRLRMGEAGRRSVLGRSWHAICSELFEHYDAVAGDLVEVTV